MTTGAFVCFGKKKCCLLLEFYEKKLLHTYVPFFLKCKNVKYNAFKNIHTMISKKQLKKLSRRPMYKQLINVQLSIIKYPFKQM